MTAGDRLVAFNRPSIDEVDLKYVVEALHDGHLSGDGRFTKMASESLSRLVGGRSVLLTTSCTHALEMTGYLANLGPGDEVIMPSFTFVSTANAFAVRGAEPVFVDIREDTLNIDEQQVAAAITSNTRAVVVVHYGGVAAEMDAIRALADAHGIWLIEDNAHGLGGTYKGEPLGAIGDMAAQSFHATKNIVMGEGGALVIDDPDLLQRAEIIREKGTNRSQFLRGVVDKYTWVDAGSSYLPSEILSALLFAQLARFDEIQNRRHEVWRSYHEALEDWALANGVRLPTVPDGIEHAAHLFYLIVPAEVDQAGLIEHLGQFGITAVSHYRPLHSSPYGSKVGRSVGDCPVTMAVADRIVRLPMHTGLSPHNVERVISATKSYRTFG